MCKFSATISRFVLQVLLAGWTAQYEVLTDRWDLVKTGKGSLWRAGEAGMKSVVERYITPETQSLCSAVIIHQM